MALTKQVAMAGAAALCAAGFVAVFGVAAPARAQTAFGQEMPRQYLFNRVINPQPDPAEVRAAGGAAQPGGAGATAANGAPSAPPQTAFGQEMPQQYLFNRVMNSQPDPAAK